MNSQEYRYRSLIQEFEHKLDRKLEAEEEAFVKWMAEQEEGDLSKHKIHLVRC